MKKTNTYILFSIALICVCSSLLLSTVVTFLKPKQQEEEKVYQARRLLETTSLFSRESTSLSDKEVLELYEKCIIPSHIQNKGTSHLYYKIFTRDGTPNSIVIPISGNGLWAMMYGFLALSLDGNTIEGLTFYKQGETPGLGGEISSPSFTDQFIGKKIFQLRNGVTKEDAILGIQIIEGDPNVIYFNSPLLNSSVEAITGATITSNAVAVVIKKSLEPFRNLLISLPERMKAS